MCLINMCTQIHQKQRIGASSASVDALVRTNASSAHEDAVAAFTRGMVVRIKVVNFVNFPVYELFPGPKLNLFLGPNTSGKTTLIKAIALGCGAPLGTDDSKLQSHCSWVRGSPGHSKS